jgi:hypothetical protein
VGSEFLPSSLMRIQAVQCIFSISDLSHFFGKLFSQWAKLTPTYYCICSVLTQDVDQLHEQNKTKRRKTRKSLQHHSSLDPPNFSLYTAFKFTILSEPWTGLPWGTAVCSEHGGRCSSLHAWSLRSPVSMFRMEGDVAPYTCVVSP